MTISYFALILEIIPLKEILCFCSDCIKKQDVPISEINVN